MYRINDKRKDWLDKIKQNQPLKETEHLYVCDLHFNENDIKKTTKKVILKKDAELIIDSMCDFTTSDICEESNSYVANSECTSEVSCGDNSYSEDLPAQVKKLKRTVNKLRTIIRDKKKEIEKMKKEMKRDQNFTKMSTVSKSIHTLLHIF